MTAPRRAAIVRAMVAAQGRPVSGESLADELGISRVAVGKHMNALRELGFEIESVHRAGHRLVALPPVTIPETVSPFVTDAFWQRFEGGPTTASTSDDAKRLARTGAAEGTVVVAARQQGGRGRLGRTWESPEGGAYFSAVVRPQIAPAQIAPLALVVALGVASGLEALGVSTMLKWPNDVLFEGRKLAGILLEMSAEADRVEWVVAGVGINVRRPEGGVDGFAYVTDVLPAVEPARVAAAALDGVAAMYRRFISGGFGSLVGEYAGRDGLRGSEVVVRDGTGAVVAAGVAGGVDDSGRLLVGDTRVFGGEVTLKDPEGGER